MSDAEHIADMNRAYREAAEQRHRDRMRTDPYYREQVERAEADRAADAEQAPGVEAQRDRIRGR